VNTHLAALDEMVDKRNIDFHDLSRRLGFRPTGAGDILDQSEVLELESIFESDVLFWLVGGILFFVLFILLTGPLDREVGFIYHSAKSRGYLWDTMHRFKLQT
jgi:hypothetical protein